MQNKVAVTFARNRMAYVINQSLSAKGIKVFAGDTTFININKLSLLDNNCFLYPNFYTSKELFLEQLINYLRAKSIQYLIPTHEEIFLISKYINRFNGIKTLVPSFESIRIAHKKDLSSAIANKLGIPIPLTIIPKSDADCISFFNAHEKPVVLKYNNSNSAKGVFYIKTISQFENHYIHLGGFLLQEYVKGEGYGVSMLYNKGHLRASFTHKRLEEKISTGGTSTLRKSTHNEMLEEWSKKILDYLSWNGVAMVEYKYDEIKKKGWFIEINPRFWGSLALPYYSGMDFPYLYYQILRDGDIEETYNYKEGIKVKWLLGGVLGFLDGIINEKQFRFNLLSLKADHYDDFSIKDPFILAGELGYYLEEFLHNFTLNPTKNSILNIDDI